MSDPRRDERAEYDGGNRDRRDEPRLETDDDLNRENRPLSFSPFSSSLGVLPVPIIISSESWSCIGGESSPMSRVTLHYFE